MRLTRVHVDAPLSSGALVALPASQGQHLTRVLRLEPGADLKIFNGQGGDYDARIETSHRGAVSVRVGAHQAAERESALRITLLQGIARGEKMDLILQKATELGVAAIVPLTMKRSTVRLNAETAERKQAHWQGVVTSACEQSGRNQVPPVAAPTDLATAVQQESSPLKLLLSPDAQARTPADLVASAPAITTIALLIGPEGGFDPDETRIAQLAGFTGCRLGPRILRTETAALAALAALQAVAGDFR